MRIAIYTCIQAYLTRWVVTIVGTARQEKGGQKDRSSSKRIPSQNILPTITLYSFTSLFCIYVYTYYYPLWFRNIRFCFIFDQFWQGLKNVLCIGGRILKFYLKNIYFVFKLLFFWYTLYSAISDSGLSERNCGTKPHLKDNLVKIKTLQNWKVFDIFTPAPQLIFILVCLCTYENFCRVFEEKLGSVFHCLVHFAKCYDTNRENVLSPSNLGCSVNTNNSSRLCIDACKDLQCSLIKDNSFFVYIIYTRCKSQNKRGRSRL